MENTPRLYDTLVHVLSQQATWLDQRHLKTLAWMMVGLIQAGWISLTAWAPYVVSRAQYAQSTVRRFRRWLDNDKIDVLSLYGPFIQQAVAAWGEQALYVALDTSMLWNTSCLVRLSVIYRGRAACSNTAVRRWLSMSTVTSWSGQRYCSRGPVRSSF